MSTYSTLVIPPTVLWQITIVFLKHQNQMVWSILYESDRLLLDMRAPTVARHVRINGPRLTTFFVFNCDLSNENSTNKRFGTDPETQTILVCVSKAPSGINYYSSFITRKYFLRTPVIFHERKPYMRVLTRVYT